MSAIIPNEALMESRNLPEHVRKQLRDVYSLMSAYLNRPDLYENPVEQIEALEYVMQWLWGFPLDKNYHGYWNKIKGCSCPSGDSEMTFGTPYRRIRTSCKWHGDLS